MRTAARRLADMRNSDSRFSRLSVNYPKNGMFKRARPGFCSTWNQALVHKKAEGQDSPFPIFSGRSNPNPNRSRHPQVGHPAHGRDPCMNLVHLGVEQAGGNARPEELFDAVHGVFGETAMVVTCVFLPLHQSQGDRINVLADTISAPSEAWRFLPGESPGRVRASPNTVQSACRNHGRVSGLVFKTIA